MPNVPVAAPGELCLPASLTASQRIALFTLRKRNCPLAVAILEKLQHSTARAGAADYRVLISQGYAARKSNGYHRLTALGCMRANILLQDAGNDLGIREPLYSGGGGYQRQIYITGSTW
jgi:uncharacterized protein (DUF2384 family)